MAVFNETLAGYRVKIHDVDHAPPHCHVSLAGRSKRVSLLTLEILNPPPHSLPPSLRRALKARRAEMLEAWDRVQEIDP